MGSQNVVVGGRRRSIADAIACGAACAAPASCPALGIDLAENPAAAPRAANVILMIADGGGFNAWAAASLHRGRLGAEVFDGEGWVHYAVSIYPLRQSREPLRLMHDNQAGRMIEEMPDFIAGVQAAVEYVERRGEAIDWSNTLLILTADHDRLLLGPNSDRALRAA